MAASFLEAVGRDGFLLWLLQQPTWAVAASVLVIGGLFTMAGLLLTNNYLTPQQLVANNIVASFKFTFLAEVFAGTMAFVMIGAADRYTVATATVNNEAALLATLEQTVRRLPDPRAFQAALGAYARAVADTEWHTMARGEESPAAQAAFEHMLDTYFAIDPTSPREEGAVLFGNQVVAMAVEARVNRLNNNVSQEVVDLSLFILVSLAAISIAFNWFFGTGRMRSQVVMGLALAAGIVSCTFLTLLLSNPYIGEYAVDPAPFLRLAAVGGAP